jgi:hypothetical protein
MKTIHEKLSDTFLVPLIIMGIEILSVLKNVSVEFTIKPVYKVIDF